MTELHLPPEQTGRFSCPVCFVRFHSLPEKRGHIRRKHGVKKPRPKR